MRPLLIDEAAKKKIAEVIAYAEGHKYPKAFLMQRVKGGGKVPGDLDGYTCHLEFGFRCVYTLEEQPIGWCHHLSVSVNDEKKVPSIPAVELLMKEFGIQQGIKDEGVHMWIEEDISPKAVNILAKK